MHGGHGYLIHQFLSPLSNQRADDTAGRSRTACAFRWRPSGDARRVAGRKALGIRLSATDWVEGGWPPEEAGIFARRLKAIGCDYIDTTTGGLDPRQKVPLSEGYQVPFGARLRRETPIVTMSVGLIDKPAYAEQLIARGDADFIVLGRGALYDPRWAWHAAEALGADTAYAPKYRCASRRCVPNCSPSSQGCGLTAASRAPPWPIQRPTSGRAYTGDHPDGVSGQRQNHADESRAARSGDGPHRGDHQRVR